MLDMADHVERAGTYALVYLAVLQHWNAVCPDEWHVRQIIPNPKATWAFARANLDLRAPAKKRKRSLEGHVKSNQRDRDRAQRRQAAKGQKGQTGWAGKGEGKREMGGKAQWAAGGWSADGKTGWTSGKDWEGHGSPGKSALIPRAMANAESQWAAGGGRTADGWSS